MKKKFIKTLVIIVLAVIIGVVFKTVKFQGTKKDKVSVEKWNNIYNGNNIHFFYQTADEINIQQVGETYKIKELVKDSNDDFEKAVKIMEWAGNVLKYSKTSMKTEGSVIEIINDTKSTGKTINADDYCSIYVELATSAGLRVRKGELRVKNVNASKDLYNHFICEVWSDKYKKWVMLDPTNNHYITYGEVPLSVMESIQKGLNNIEIAGGSDAKKYIRNIEKYFYSYTIPIDNRIYGIGKINSYVTYMKKGDNPEIYIKDKIVIPTIFTSEEHLFNISPKTEHKNNIDTTGTLIFSQKKNDDDSKNKISLNGGVFKNSVMSKDYFININNSKWRKVEEYFKFDLVNGENTIKYSSDGKKVEREVIINYLGDDKK